MAVLEVNNIKKIYTARFGSNRVQALSDVSFSVEAGEYVAVMGESGSGKTTLLNIIAALDKPTDGEVYLDGRKFSEIKEATLVHWDLWEGNVFIKDGHVSGIIDWERAMWGESLMDDRFRHHNKNDAFLIGFGKESFTEKEKKVFPGW